MVLGEEEDDLVSLLDALFASAAHLTRWPDWRIDDEEARSIAKPLARILVRHGDLAAIVQKVADPVAVVVSAVAIIAPRMVGYRLALAEQERRRMAPAQRPAAGASSNGSASSSADTAPPPPPPTGGGAVNFAERLIRENGV